MINNKKVDKAAIYGISFRFAVRTFGSEMLGISASLLIESEFLALATKQFTLVNSLSTSASRASNNKYNDLKWYLNTRLKHQILLV